MNETPKIGEAMPAGWFVDRTHYTVKHGWLMHEFRRCWTRGPHQPTSSPRWKPVWRFKP